MSSKIKIIRICIYCNNEFTARTTSTKYCSHKCNSRDYKKKIKESRISKSHEESKQKVTFSIEKLKVKEFLTVEEVAKLLNCSKRVVYYNINCGHIDAVNLGQRVTRIKRSSLDRLFDSSTF